MKPHFDEKYKGIMCRVYLVKENADSEVIIISNPSSAYELVRNELVSSDRERFLSIMLNNRKHLIGVETVYIGTVNSVTVSPMDIFKSAILANAVSIIFAHNHPSAGLVPSKQDVELTRVLMEAGRILGIEVLDHLIVSERGYMSIKEQCLF